MFYKKKLLLIFLFSFLCNGMLYAQKDTLILNKQGTFDLTKTYKSSPDTAKKYNPKKAIIRSALIPGWGQAYNKKYWKIPIVYGALGTTTFLFFRNLKQYKEAREAYINATDGDASNDYLIKDPYYSVRSQPERIRTFRNEVRQNVDYSVLFFIIFWGLNVADAAVDAHLKTFDVSDNLSFELKPGYSPMANTNGVSLVLNLGRKNAK